MNKTFKYIVLLALACFVGKANAQELKTEVFSLLNLDYPGLEKVKALHQEAKMPMQPKHCSTTTVHVPT